jgi:hypothetical protein
MMDSLQPEVYTALSGTGYTVLYLYPQGAANVPCVTWRESNNREYGQADGNEFVTEVEYTIDCWATTPEATATMALTVDTALAALRLKRTFSHDLYETDTRVHRKNMRYRALIRIDEQRIYQ